MPSSDPNWENEFPAPSKKSIPEWYKKIPAFNEKKAIFDENNVCQNDNVKMCMPFFDAISAGYIQKTWTDIYIKKEEDDSVTYRVKTGPNILKARNNINIKIDTDLYYNIEFTWIEPWLPIVPEGYSVIYTHPFNRLDLPFTTLSAIIDSDNYYHSFGGSYPFYIKKDFEGVIPAGTPMYQMIPIKRESWRSEFDEFSIKNLKKFMESRSVFWEFYKNKFWQKKNYL